MDAETEQKRSQRSVQSCRIHQLPFYYLTRTRPWIRPEMRSTTIISKVTIIDLIFRDQAYHHMRYTPFKGLLKVHFTEYTKWFSRLLSVTVERYCYFSVLLAHHSPHFRILVANYLMPTQSSSISTGCKYASIRTLSALNTGNLHKLSSSFIPFSPMLFF